MVEKEWSRTLGEELWSFQQQSYLCDMEVLASDGTVFNVHSCVMAATSSLFKASTVAWTSSARTNSASRVKTQVSSDLLPCVIRYLYTGQIKVESDRLVELHAALVELGMNRDSFARPPSMESPDEHPSSPGIQDDNDEASEGETLSILDNEFETRTGITERAGDTILKEEEEAQSECGKTALQSDTVGGSGTSSVPRVFEQSDCEKTLIDNFIAEVNPSVKSSPEMKKRWPCNSCGESFLTKWRLKKHAQLHTNGEHPYKCQECGKCYNQHGNLWKHQQTHRTDKPFPCPVCSKAFKARHVLVEHVRSVHKISLQRMQTQIDDSKDIQEKRGTEGIPKPGTQDEASEGEPLLNLEFETQTVITGSAGDTKLKEEGAQSECGRTAIQSDTVGDSGTSSVPRGFEQRVYKETLNFIAEGNPSANSSPEMKKRWPCNSCGESFLTKWRLKKHAQLHTTGEHPYKCQKCGKCYKHHGNLWQHQQTHRTDRPFACPLCSKAFKARHVLAEHARSVHKMSLQQVQRQIDDSKDIHKEHGTKGSPAVNESKSDQNIWSLARRQNQLGDVIQCSQCGKVFKRKCNLRDHMRVHSDVRPFPCGICGKAFKEKATLEEHAKYIHEGAQRTKKRYKDCIRFRCSHCFKGFKLKQHLNIHEMRHTGERPFQCRYCDLAYVTETERKAHEGKHTGTVPFQCEQCGKGFFTSGNLCSHMMSHSEERPYACSVCGKCFKTKSHRRKHENIHT